MRTKLITIGNKMPDWVNKGFSEYQKRLSHSFPIELVEIPLQRRTKKADIDKCQQLENQQLLNPIDPNDHVIMLDKSGSEWTSEALAKQLNTWKQLGKNLIFTIGGPEGFTTDSLARANQQWSLGKLTLPHPLARLIVIEALYRAQSILDGLPYHK
ncbi:MAG: 23S rRNA (pseudouridine(1915)-N(3))-methyltransferase RlmH [Gammaproteobacteria bacterium]